MLRRLYIDNYKCFVNFELELDAVQLLMGTNGVGKSAVLDVLRTLRDFVAGEVAAEHAFPTETLTWWQGRDEQTFEFDVELPEGLCTYRLVLAHDREHATCGVKSERVTCGGRDVVAMTQTMVAWSDTQGLAREFLHSPSRSALSLLPPDPAVEVARALCAWLGDTVAVRLNPFAMALLSERESSQLAVDGSNFASWFRDWLQRDPSGVGPFFALLREAVSGFVKLGLDPVGRVRSLSVEFEPPNGEAGGKPASCGIDQLSDGQKALVVLYAIYQSSLGRKGQMVILDEPDNFVALEEIEPWLALMGRAVEDGEIQLLLCSHHPEIINRLAPHSAKLLYRDETGPARVRPFSYDGDEPLTPAELVARGWLQDE